MQDANDAADQIENLTAKIANLIILSHGDTKDPPGHSAYFAIGSQIFNSSDKINKSDALSRIAPRLASTPGPLPSNAQVVLFACGVGGTYNGGVELLKSLAKKLNATVFGSQSVTPLRSGTFNGDSASVSTNGWPNGHPITPGNYSNAYNNTGKWTMAYQFGTTQESSTITNVYFDSFGRIHYSQ